MISTRNVESSKTYVLKASYSGGSKKELKKTKAKTIEDAINQTVKRIPGGEYLMNAKIYLVNGEYFAVEGDVWGIAENNSFRGFTAGDKVTWKNKATGIQSGVIHSLKDDQKCIVETESGELIEIEYDKLSKVQ
jgi:hypothetical protein